MEYMFAMKALNPAGSSNNSNSVTAMHHIWLVAYGCCSCSLHSAVPILCSGPPVVGDFHLVVYDFSLTVTFLVSIWYIVYIN